MKTKITLFTHKILLISLALPCITNTMESQLQEKYEGNTYKGNLISIDTLAQLAEHYTPLPEHIKNKLQQWFEDEVVIPNDLNIEMCLQEIKEKSDVPMIKQNKDLVTYLIQLPDDLSKTRAKSDCNQKILKIIALSRNVYPRQINYIFEPIDGNVLRIAGIVNRLYTTISGQDRGDKWLDPWGQEGQFFIKNPESRKNLIIMPTYQTISIYANYLLLKKFIEEKGLTHIITPNTYLVHIPDRPKQVSDDNYVVLQDKVEGALIDLATNPCAWKKLSDDALRDLFIAARTGLWDINNNNLLVDKNGNVVLLDLEQPNNSDPRAFFNKPMSQEWGAIRGRSAYARYIVDGIEIITQMMEKAQEECPTIATQLALWKLLIQQNNNLVRRLNQGQQERLDSLGR